MTFQGPIDLSASANPVSCRAPRSILIAFRWVTSGFNAHSAFCRCARLRRYGHSGALGLELLPMKRLRGKAGSWKRSSQRVPKRRAARANDWAKDLAVLSKIREPFGSCARELTARLIREYLSDAEDVIEVGAGSGQLRRWLPQSEEERWVFTDPDARALEDFRHSFPTATVRSASLEALPFDDHSQSGVVGLCILDMVPDLTVAFSEIRRVLRPGGRLIHLLDMAPYHAKQFEELAARRQLAFPNVFGEPLTTAWPLDLLVTDQAPLNALLAALKRVEHPLASVFGRYFAAAMARPFDAERTCTEFDGISRTSDVRRILRATLESAYRVGYRLGLEPPRGTLSSSGRHLASRLEDAARNAGFHVELNNVLTAWGHVALTEPSIRHRIFSLGQGRTETVLDAPRLCADAPPPGVGEQLIELGIMAFVARAPD